MSKLAKGLMGAFVLVACAAQAGDDGPSEPVEVAGVEMALVAPAALPGGLGARIQRTCTTTFPRGVERMLFGARGAPKAVKDPHRVIPAGASRPLRVAAGAITLDPAPNVTTRVASARVAAQADGANVLVSGDGSMQISTVLRGAKPVIGTASDGLVTYSGGYPGGDVVVRPKDDGAEDWILLERAPVGGAIEYDVALTRGVAAVRNVGNTVEFLDGTGVPRLRMAPPSLVDADCKTVEVAVAVTGCTVDRNPDAPFGKSHPAPRAGTCKVSLSWNGSAVKYPISVDPEWSGTASMSVPRAFHSAHKLESPERVLVVGGISWPGYTVQATAELYDPTSNT